MKEKALQGKTIVVGVTGCIAVYKACDVVNWLRQAGASVKVIMTKNACEFVGPLTFETLSQNPVVTDMFADKKTWEVEHISLARGADLLLVAPATYNLINKVVGGIADDMLSTVIAATPAPIVFAPAMNDGMWANPILQDNIKKLETYGKYSFIAPKTSMLACGYVGTGALAKPADIVDYVVKFLSSEEA